MHAIEVIVSFQTVNSWNMADRKRCLVRCNLRRASVHHISIKIRRTTVASGYHSRNRFPVCMMHTIKRVKSDDWTIKLKYVVFEGFNHRDTSYAIVKRKLAKLSNNLNTILCTAHILICSHRTRLKLCTCYLTWLRLMNTIQDCW